MSFNVLVCDDSALARRMAKRALPEGFADEIFEASHGGEAIALLKKQPIDLLLLDLTMPVVDGIGVLESIKQNQQDVFVVVVSGDIQPLMQRRVLSLGALDFIAKPIDTRRLERVLNEYGMRVASIA